MHERMREVEYEEGPAELCRWTHCRSCARTGQVSERLARVRITELRGERRGLGASSGIVPEGRDGGSVTCGT